MRYFLTGATGFIGRHIAEALRDEGHEVRCLARRPEKGALLAARGIEIVTGDLADAMLLREAAKGADVVIHAAAQVGEWGTRRRFEDANVAGTRNVLAAAEAAGAERLVHVSSVAVYGRQSGPALPEDTPYQLTGDRYCDTKIAAEELVWERHRAGRVRATLIRPCVVYGPYDWKFIPKVAQGLRAGRIPLIAGGRHRAPIVFVKDVSDLALTCARKPEALGEAFNCASPEGITWRELFTEVARLTGAPPPVRSVPFPLAYGVASALEGLYRLAGSRKPPLLTRFSATLLGTPMQYDGSKAERVLGFKPRVTVKTGLPETVAWMQAEMQRAGRA